MLIAFATPPQVTTFAPVIVAVPLPSAKNEVISASATVEPDGMQFMLRLSLLFETTWPTTSPDVFFTSSVSHSCEMSNPSFAVLLIMPVKILAVVLVDGYSVMSAGDPNTYAMPWEFAILLESDGSERSDGRVFL